MNEASPKPEHMVRLADEMARYGNDREAPARAVMGMLGDRWTTLILLVLWQVEIRHAELKRAMEALSYEGAISQRVLTLKLRALERDGFVQRTVSDDVPPKVSYRLTELGQELSERARTMIDWINTRSGTIRENRERYDSESSMDG
ncbi:transcriptional regulator, HxlR family [Novosphingobium mathurense]|uniref:Transcriptional regulator, HxlR family n=2 Tax=Novosphingobium mathurense TaxID=428990 RepID=A0A1U6IUG4_9SPHN|nr:transcriptional regulator, HxlR family [Novosphingobium mathurense]